MFDRIQAAWIALTARNVIVVSKGFQFNTYPNATCIQAGEYVKVEAGRLPS